MKGATILSLFLGFFMLLLCTTESSAQSCFSNMTDACNKKELSDVNDMKKACTSIYSGVQDAENQLQKYIMQHILQSYSYLKMSVLFSSFAKNREGFEKLYRKLSDDAWKDAIELTKYMGKRGLSANFHVGNDKRSEYNKVLNDKSKVTEIWSLSAALDMHKELATSAHKIHESVTKLDCHKLGRDGLRKADCAHHDSEVESYIENEFVHKHADTVRTLAGHLNDLTLLSAKKPQDPQLEIYVFDQYLKKIV